MIERPTILVTSIGRTGTEFFSKLFADVIPDCTSLHEPNTIVITSHIENRLEQYVQQVRRAGIWRMVFLKSLGKWNLAKLSDSRFLGVLSLQKATRNLYTQRAGFISKLPGSVYVEANLGYYGLLDVMPEVFKYHRAIYLVRDGRTWVRSMLNWGEVYGKGSIRNLFSHKWPTAKDVRNDECANQWHVFSRFEQLCWAWSRLNEYALNTISKNPSARTFKFENIFMDENRYQILGDLMTFAVSLPGIDSESLKQTDGWLEHKTHQSSNKFPGQEKWTRDQRVQFEKICGPLMDKLGYEF